MEKKTLQEVGINVREAYARALKNCSRPEFDIAIEGLKEVVKVEPLLGVARDKLREIERKKAQSMNIFTKIAPQISGFLRAGKVKMLKKDYVKALAECEDELAKYLYIQPILSVMAEVARDAQIYFIEIEALSLIREIFPKNEANLRRLAKALQDNGQAREGLKVFQEVAAKHPKNMAIQSELRAALALASMERGRWEEEGSTQQRAVGAQDTISAQINEGTIHSSDQAAVVIEKLLKDLQEGDSVDIRRRLAEAYMVAKRYDEAITEFLAVADKLGAMDPLLDKNIEKAKVAKYDIAIDEAADQAQKDAIAKERDDYMMERALDRVKKYPNDALLRYDLAVLYFEDGKIDEALEQFQLGRRSPQRRLLSLVYMGRCFDVKGQYDLAVEQYELAIKEMYRMDKEKMDAIYYLALTLEKMENFDRAMDCYKEIYQHQSNFRDVAARIDEFYKNKQQAK